MDINLIKIELNINIDLSEILKDIKGRISVAKSKIENVKTPPNVIPLNMNATFISSFQCFHIFNQISFEGKFGDNPDVYLIFSKYGSEIRRDSQSDKITSDGIIVSKLKKLSFMGTTYSYQINEQNCYYSVKKDELQVKPFILVVDGGDCLGFTVLYYINKTFNVSANSMRIPYMGRNSFHPSLLAYKSWPRDEELREGVSYENQTYYLDEVEIKSIKKIKKDFLESLDASYREKMKEKYADDE